MDELSQAKKLVEESMRSIEFFKANHFAEKQTYWYHKELERLYIAKIKAELSLGKLELIKK